MAKHNRIRFEIILIIILINCTAFSFGKKDIVYYESHKKDAQKKIEACQMAMWSANGNIAAIEKIQNDSECIAAEKALKNIQKKEYENRIKLEKKNQIIAKNKFDESVKELASLPIIKLTEMMTHCSNKNFPFSECQAIRKARKNKLDSQFSAKKKELSNLTDKQLVEITYDNKSKFSTSNFSLYCNAIRSIIDDRVTKYKNEYANNKQERDKIYKKCTIEAKKIYRQTKNFIIDSRKFSEPLKCRANSLARTMNFENPNYDLR